MSNLNINNSEKESWQKVLILKSTTLTDAIKALNCSGVKLLLVQDDQGKLCGTVSDGDIRAALLDGFKLESPINEMANYKPIVVRKDKSRATILNLMLHHKIQQIPVVDDDFCIIGLHSFDKIVEHEPRTNRFVIMAGGKGTRLRPYTEDCPKPLLKIGGKPIIEHIIERASNEGFKNFSISINYLGEMIESYFGDGSRWGVNIEYLHENTPLGTAGALGMLEPHPNESFIVTNGDLLSDINYTKLLEFHLANDALATMAVQTYELQNPFGVVHTKGIDIVAFEEKPIYRAQINAGVYVLSPATLKHIPVNEHYDMPAVFEQLNAKSQRTVVYPMHEPWLDVGRPDDLVKARKILSEEYEVGR